MTHIRHMPWEYTTAPPSWNDIEKSGTFFGWRWHSPSCPYMRNYIDEHVNDGRRLGQWQCTAMEVFVLFKLPQWPIFAARKVWYFPIYLRTPWGAQLTSLHLWALGRLKGQGLVVVEMYIANLSPGSLDLVHFLPVFWLAPTEKRKKERKGCACCGFMEANYKTFSVDSVCHFYCYVVLSLVALRVYKEGFVVACFRWYNMTGSPAVSRRIYRVFFF